MVSPRLKPFLPVSPPLRALLGCLLLASPAPLWGAPDYAPTLPSGHCILTPAPGPAPRLHGPTIHGVRPGSPFLHRIPCTGERPMTFAAEALPTGLTLDARAGIITGKISTPGTHHVTLVARNARGAARREFRIVVGDALALTPPMGWNNWYIHYDRVSDAHLRQAADQMIASGMADFGYQYVNLDDCWMKKMGDEPYRGGNGAALPNAKFPDMRALADYIHGRGLKVGIYTSPGPWTCSGYVGACGHEAQDAKQFADWGFDFLKYDWCSYQHIARGGDAGDKDLKFYGEQKRPPLADSAYQKPYREMSALLRTQSRDLVFNLCEYGRGGEVGHSWRTTGDLGVEKDTRLPAFYTIGLRNAQHWEYARPGAWNDPDYILIGWVGDAHRMGEGTRTTLTPDEQYSYMSLWSLMAAPLIFSGDMAKLDAFTLNILCNAEVIEANQDALGRQARILRQTANELALVKDLEDGSKVIGLFNLGDRAVELSVAWPDLALSGRQLLRDLWRQRDIGEFDRRFTALVPAHGVVLLHAEPVK